MTTNDGGDGCDGGEGEVEEEERIETKIKRGAAAGAQLQKRSFAGTTDCFCN